MMFSANDIAISLNEESCNQVIEEIFADRPHDESYETCCALMKDQRAEFLGALDDIVDGSDLSLLIATRYIEQKSRWIQWNLVLNYRMLVTGTFDRTLACKASVLSNLLGRIEPFIDEESLARINELLNEPILASAV
jgi:hypothetical protein